MTDTPPASSSLLPPPTAPPQGKVATPRKGRLPPKTKRVAVVACSTFASEAARVAFYSHLEQAQNANLQGKTDEAQLHCLRALRLNAHPTVFALLETIAEQRGDFAKAREFRLLHAFMAKDPVMWRQLYQDYMESSEFYRAVVCLKRLAALSTSDEERRQLTLDRADLLVGLGELPQAMTAYEQLWNKSNCTDFETFALLSALYFQLGRGSALQRLIAKAKATLMAQRQAADGAFDTKGYLMLVNVECESLLERGMYDTVISTVHEAAKTLDIDVHALNPDVLVRLSMALCLMGDKTGSLRALASVFEASGETEQVVVENYGDALFDAAEVFTSAGWFAEAKDLLQRMMDACPSELRIAATYFLLGKAHLGLGDATSAHSCFNRVLAEDPKHAKTRIELAKLAMELDDLTLARTYVTVGPDDDALDAIVLRAMLCRVELLRKDYVRCVEAGNAVLELLEVLEDDMESVATGASKRRSSSQAFIPSLVRASSAIVPATSLAAMLPSSSTAGSSLFQQATSTVGSRIAASISASFKIGSIARSSVALSKRSSIAASSVAASSVAGGGGRGLEPADGEVFRFHKVRKTPASMKRRVEDVTGHTAQQMKRPQPSSQHDVGRLEDLAGFDEADSDDGSSSSSSSQGSLKDEDPVKQELDDDDDAPFSQLFSQRQQVRRPTAPDLGEFAVPDLPAALSTKRDDASPSEFDLPSLESIAKSAFEDDDMRALFLKATEGPAASRPTNEPNADDDLQALAPRFNEGGVKRLDELAQLQAAKLQAGQPATGHDVLRLLGVAGVAELTTHVISAYEVLGQLLEAKDVANYVRVQLPKYPGKRTAAAQQATRHLARVHLRLSAFTGDPQEGLQNAVRCLVDASDLPHSHPDIVQIWHLVNRMEQQLGDKSKVLHRFAQLADTPHATHPLLAVVSGHRALLSRTYAQAARCYWAALPSYPDDAMLHLLLAVSYGFLTMRKGIHPAERHECVQHACAFLEHYVVASQTSACADPLVAAEVAFNSARLYHYLWLPHLALPLYEKCAELCATLRAVKGSAAAVPGFADVLSPLAALEAVRRDAAKGVEWRAMRLTMADALHRAATHGLALMYRDGNDEESPTLETVPRDPARGAKLYNEVLQRAPAVPL